MATQKEYGLILIQITNIMDFIDDGYHNKEICNLVKLRNEIYSKLTPTNQKKASKWLEKKLATED